MEDLENYAEQTYSSLLYLILETLNVKNLNIDHIASHLGKAVGMIGILRATPFHSSRERYYLPSDLSAQEGLSRPDVIRYMRSFFAEKNQSTKNSSYKYTMDPSDVERISNSLQSVVHQVASRAYQHVETAKAHLDPNSDAANCLPTPNKPSEMYIKRAFPAFINVIPTQLYLQTLQKNNFDVLRSLKHSSNLLPMKVWYYTKRLRLP